MEPSLNSVGNSRKMCHCVCVCEEKSVGRVQVAMVEVEYKDDEALSHQQEEQQAGESSTYLFIILQLQPCSLTITIIRHRDNNTHWAFHSDKMMTLITSRLYTTEWLNAPCEQPTSQKEGRKKGEGKWERKKISAVVLPVERRVGKRSINSIDSK